MFYYQHNAQSELTGKSTENFPGAWYCDLDFDIDRYRIIVSSVSTKGQILRWRSNVRNGEQADVDKQRLETLLTEIKNELIDVKLPAIEGENKSLNDRLSLLEDCITEMANIIYA